MMPQTPDRKREYMRGYMREYMRRRRGKESEEGGVKSLIDTGALSPWREIPPFSHHRTVSARRAIAYMAALNRRGLTLAETSRGYEIVDMATLSQELALTSEAMEAGA